MPKTKILIALLAAILCTPAMLHSQEKESNPEELLEKEIERLTANLKLEEWQVYYVDSTLHYDYYGMMQELDRLRKTRVSNQDMYIAVQDKWLESTQNAYHKFFTDEQWLRYLKQGGQRIINERERRRSKAAGKTETKKKK